MNPWFIDATWQNFSSSFREATTASEAKTGMERSHHLTASLYFGIAALESFLNAKMRAHLHAAKSPQEILDTLRKGRLMSKLEKWPEQLLGHALSLKAGSFELLRSFNDIRGDLTHPKTSGHDTYKDLEEIEPQTILDVVAEYIVRYCEAEGCRYPYWIFGWNYLNPRMDAYDIILINDQQFAWSLQAFGMRVPPSYGESELWKNKTFGTYAGYLSVQSTLLNSLCEPKSDRFPFKPVLCKRWWSQEHHRSCGHVTAEAISRAQNYGA